MNTRILLTIFVAALLTGAGYHLLHHRSAPAVAPSDKPNRSGSFAARGELRSRIGARHATDLATAAASAAVETTTSAATNSFWQRLLDGEGQVSKVSERTLESYLTQNRSNAESLVTAWQKTKSPELLRLAASNVPKNGLVMFTIVANNAFPDERRQWIEQFKEAAPDNSLPNYFAARDYFKAGQTDLAVQELLAASQKPFQDYSRERMQAAEELYLADGRSPAEAKALGQTGLTLPHLAQFKDLSTQIESAQKQYVAGGDGRSAEALAQLGTTLGRQLSTGGGSDFVINQLVGIAVQSIALRSLDPNTPVSFLQDTPAARLAQLRADKDAIRESARGVERWMSEAAEPDLVAYFDRIKMFGERSALAWLRNRQGRAP